MPESWPTFTQSAMGRHRRVLGKVRDLWVWLTAWRNHRKAENGKQGDQQEADAIVQVREDSG